MRISFGAKINFALLAGFSLVAIVGFYSYQSIDELVETSRAEARAFNDIRRIEGIAANLVAAEAAMRRHLAVRSDPDRLEFESVRSQVFAEIGILRERTREGGQRLRLDHLNELATQRLDVLAQAIRSGRGAADLVHDSRQLDLERRIERLVQEFLELEGRALRHREADTTRSAETTSFMIVWGGMLAVTLLLWAMVVINRYHAQRQAAEAALRASETQLRLVIEGMPALIAYLDSNERLAFHNSTLERWFGTRSHDLVGRGLREVAGETVYSAMQPHLASALSGQRVQFNFSAAGPDGQPRDLDAILVPRRGDQGQVIGCFALVTDISELKRLERLKAEFVSTVSHELRTPLTSIRGSLGLLAGGAVGALPEAAAKLIGIASNNCERLVRLVSDILDVERLESGKMSFRPQAIALGELVEQAIKANEGFAAAHGASVRLADARQDARVLADPDRINQVMSNLLSNACKFSPAGGVVEVAVTRGKRGARVSVSDRGPGIPESFRPRIFERFSQADGSSAREKGGTGLGLAISRAIIERSQGEIGFETREGGGTTFFFELPEHRG